MTRLLLVPVLLLAAAGPLRAQGRGEVELARLHFPVRVDGVVGDSAWNLIEPLPLTMHAPSFRGRPVERTEIRVAYDDEYLYASGRFFDSRPDRIRINSLYRDRWSGDDNFALFVDGFNDHETGLWFGTTPAGIRIDQTISDDARVYNDGWRIRVLLEPTWNLSRHLEIGGGYELNRIRFPERGRSLDAHVARIRVGAAANARLSATVLAPAQHGGRPARAQSARSL